MNRLISASFLRLRRHRPFWLLLCAMAVWGAYNAVTLEAAGCLEGRLFEYVPLMGFAAAIFISLFVGTEYSDGAIRNKLIAGHTRPSVYFSNFVTCAAGDLLLTGSYLAVFLIVGIAKGGKINCNVRILIPYVIFGLLIAVAFTSLMVFLAMLNRSKAGSAIVCLLVALILFASCGRIHQRLAEPELYEHYIAVNEFGIPTEVENAPNPLYVGGARRKALAFVENVLPAGQAMQLVDSFDDGGLIEREHCDPLGGTAYAAAFSALLTGIGMAVFRKKEIK